MEVQVREETVGGSIVLVVDGSGSPKFDALAAAMACLGSYSVEHEADAEYGLSTTFTLSDGLWSYVREVDEDRIGMWLRREEAENDRNIWAREVVKVLSPIDDGRDSYWYVEVNVDPQRLADEAA